jgi:hypothetical protein
MDKWDEFLNALAWFKPGPSGWQSWFKSPAKNLEAIVQWIWEVLQGDFNEDQTTAQIATGTVISMIPFVDQICDVRDVVANCKKINQDTSNKWAWIGLVLTLIGLFPTLGSLAKGCLKIVFAYGRKGAFSVAKNARLDDFWSLSKPYVEAGIQKLNDFLARPEVRKTLQANKWDNAYKELATLTRELSSKINVSELTKYFDEIIKALKEFVDWIGKYGSAAMKTKAGDLLTMVRGIRDKANTELANVIKPVQDWLNKLAQRLDVEHALRYKASTNTVNPHNYARHSLDAELEAIQKKLPKGVKVAKKGEFSALKNAPKVPPGHFDISKKAKPPLRNAFNTFHDIRPDHLPEGTVIYRVLDPKSNDNSICWMTKAEFDLLHNKDMWRERFAVWKNWNSNGEYLTYTVPKGGMPVWRGTTASQPFKDANENIVKASSDGEAYWLKGGHEQIVVNPALLDPKMASKRDFTGWGYKDGDIEVNLIGVPVLETNWRK